jgi:hypothetical protein
MEDEILIFPVRKRKRLLVYPFLELQTEEESGGEIFQTLEEEPMRELVEITKTGRLVSIKEKKEDLEDTDVFFDE